MPEPGMSGEYSNTPAHEQVCPDCDGVGFNVEARHNCDGHEAVCAQVCPVPTQVPCACAPRVQTPPYLPPEEEPF